MKAKLLSSLAIGAAALVATPASATIVGSLGGGTGTFLSLSSSGLNGGAVATLTGGTIETSDQPFADIPAGGVFENTFLASGPSTNAPATLTFTNAVDYLSFLWGSPDLYNVLTITTNVATYDFTAALLGFTTTNGDQSVSQYVQFSTGAGEHITGATFNNAPPIDAFETANFSITSGVPEPATWAMMLLGFGGIGFSMRRRQKPALAQLA